MNLFLILFNFSLLCIYNVPFNNVGVNKRNMHYIFLLNYPLRINIKFLWALVSSEVNIFKLLLKLFEFLNNIYFKHNRKDVY